MASRGDDAPAVLNAFLLLYLEDQESGTAKTLADYQAAYPGYEELIRTEYARLTGDVGLAGEDLDTVHLDALSDEAGDGETLGPYRLLRILGEGGMGIVYLAEQREPIRRLVAIKLIKRGMDTRDVIRRFDAERQALALMQHAHIARVYDAGTGPDGRPYFVMEYVPGVPIREHCDTEKLTHRERVELFAGVCYGVQHAHQKGIIHRDLKSSNILVVVEDGCPVPKIIDFGITKLLDQPLTEGTLFTEQGHIIGTPEYMSPEQATSGGVDVDTRSDVYSLGVLLYELLIGLFPFDSQELRRSGFAEIVRRIQTEDPPSPSTRLQRVGDEASGLANDRRTTPRQLVRELRGDLDWIVMKALEKEKERRYATVFEFAADLERHLNHLPVLARPPSLRYRSRKFVRKHRVPLGIAASLAVMGMLILLWARQRFLEDRRLGAEALLQTASNQLAESRQANEDFERLQEAWDTRSAEFEHWRPVWQMGSLFAAKESTAEAKRRAGLAHGQATLRLQQALQESPPEWKRANEAKALLSELYSDRYQEMLQEGEIRLPAEFFWGLMQNAGLELVKQGARAAGAVRLTSEPPGADVFLARYVERERRLQPVLILPGEKSADEVRVVGKPFLEVESVWETERSAYQDAAKFLPGDRLLAVRGKDVVTYTDFATALQGAAEGESVPVRVLRRGESQVLEWIPFPQWPAHLRELTIAPLKAGEVINVFYQFGFTFNAYPLEFGDDYRFGTTTAGAALEWALPPGSYLVVLRRDGFVETRYPLTIPAPEVDHHVRLLPVEQVPDGFVYVPAGDVSYGGDSLESFQSSESQRDVVAGIFMGRLEVTIGEYLEFLNDPQEAKELTVGQAAELLERSGLPDFPVARPRQGETHSLVPRGIGLTQQDGRFSLKDSKWANRPIVKVPMVAALQYAEWLTERYNKRWRFRIPTALEWEKAARGVDRRVYVWGKDLVWSFCHSEKGRMYVQGTLEPAGSHPFDESVYGVRDLAGSVSEPTVDSIPPDLIGRRGGSWVDKTDYDFRTATRNGRLPTGMGLDQGIRLVADLPEE